MKVKLKMLSRFLAVGEDRSLLVVADLGRVSVGLSVGGSECEA